MTDELASSIQTTMRRLLDEARTSDGRQYTYEEIAEQLSHDYEFAPTADDLHQLTTGEAESEDIAPAHLRAVATWTANPNAFASEIIRLKIRRLRSHNRKPTGEQYTLREMAQQIHDLGFDGPAYSYLSQIVNGHRPNPGTVYLQAIAAWAGVPMSYFFDDELASRVERQLEQLTQERMQLQQAREQHRAELSDDRAKLMALRASELSDESFNQVSGLLDVVYRLEHPDHDDSGE